MKRSGLKALLYKTVATAIGIISLGVPATLAADKGNTADMDMSGTHMSGSSSQGLRVAATVHPNPPVVGDNTLDLVITDPQTGKPVSGLKLTASVAMTSMDMGTTRPKVREVAVGHYRAVVNFSMNGPWRVIISEQGAAGKAVASLDFAAGSKAPWVQPSSAPSAGALAPGPQTGTTASVPNTAAGKMPMGNMSMGNMSMGNMSMEKPSSEAGPPTPGHSAYMDTMSHPMHALPRLKERAVIPVTGNEDWKVRTGFGQNAPMVGMMIQMMVEGSGMDHMKMAPMKMDFGSENWTGEGDQAMAGMEMGGGNGAGMNMGSAPAPASLTVLADAAIAPNSPVVGNNTLDLVLKDPATGQPLAGLKMTATVTMTTMDMGTFHPRVQDLGQGRYRTVVNFNMAGPWRVALRGQGPAGRMAAIDLIFEPGNQKPWTAPGTGGATLAPAATEGMPAGVGAVSGASGARSVDGEATSRPEHAGALATRLSDGHEADQGHGSGQHEAALSPPGQPSSAQAGGNTPHHSPGGELAPAAPAEQLPVVVTLSPNPPIVGDNKLDIMVTDPRTGLAMAGLKLSTAVAMKTMDMGTGHPAVHETGGSHYSTTVHFSMAGPWTVTLVGAGPSGLHETLDFDVGSKERWVQPGSGLKVTAALPAPHVGQNRLILTLMDAHGRPIAGASVGIAVGMSSMNMGIGHPAVRDIGGGRYEATVDFSMAGPWRITAVVDHQSHHTAPGAAPVLRAFDFQVKG